MGEASSVALMKRLYPASMADRIGWENTELESVRPQFLRWFAEAARIVNFARRIGSQASCYVKGGQAAIDNADRFVSWAQAAVATGRIS